MQSVNYIADDENTCEDIRVDGIMITEGAEFMADKQYVDIYNANMVCSGLKTEVGIDLLDCNIRTNYPRGNWKNVRKSVYNKFDVNVRDIDSSEIDMLSLRYSTDTDILGTLDFDVSSMSDVTDALSTSDMTGEISCLSDKDHYFSENNVEVYGLCVCNKEAYKLCVCSSVESIPLGNSIF